MGDRKENTVGKDKQKNQPLNNTVEKFSWGGTTPQWEEEAEELMESIHGDDEIQDK